MYSTLVDPATGVVEFHKGPINKYSKLIAFSPDEMELFRKIPEEILKEVLVWGLADFESEYTPLGDECHDFIVATVLNK